MTHEPIKKTLLTMNEDLLVELIQAAQLALNDVDTIERVSKESGVSVPRLDAITGIFVDLSVVGQIDHKTEVLCRTTQDLDRQTAELAALQAEFNS